jgi:hypothetical protein
MNWKFSYTITYIFIIILASCSGGKFKQADRYEGLKGDNLRVYVRFKDSAVPEELPDNAAVDKMILEAGKERSALLLTSYAKSKMTDTVALREINFYVVRNIPDGKIVFRDYDDKKIEAFVDYNVKEILGKINSNEK